MIVRSLFPRPKVRKGDKFMVTEDLQLDALTHYLAPFTDGFKCTIPKGTLIKAASDSDKFTLGFSAVPIDYKQFEMNFVPKDQREGPKYDGYSLVVMYNEIDKHLTRVK